MMCPQCGAPLPRGAKRRPVQCEHCGTRLEPDVGEAPAHPSEPSPEQTGRPLTFPTPPRHTYRTLIAVVPTLLAYGVYMFVWRQAQPQSAAASRSVATVAASTAPGSTPSKPTPEPGPAPRVFPGLLLVPAAHAGDADNLIAVVEEPGAQRKRWLAAFDGGRGDVLWRWSLDRDPNLADAHRAAIDRMLLVASPGTVYALSLETGEVSWSRDTGGRVESLCSGDGYAGLSFPNQRFVAFSVATGSSVKGRPEACAEVLSSRSVAPNFSVVDGKAVDPPLPSRAPLDVQRVLVPHKGKARVVLGTDASRRARVAVASRDSWLWDARLGRGHANRARLLSPPLAAVRNERLVVPYVLDGPAELRLASLDLASGRLVWDEALTQRDVEARWPEAELRISRAGTIYFSNGKGQLWVVGFDSQLMWKLGER